MATKDNRHRFLIEQAQVRGVLVRLGDTWREVLERAEYPSNVQQVLGHAMVAIPILASTIKFAGKLTLQARGSGPVSLLVVQGSADGGQRGLARWGGEPPESPLRDVFGDATLSIQIEGGKTGEVYQGIVEVTGEHLQDALAGYFENSEQLPTRLWLMCDGEQAAGLMLQQLPSEDTNVTDTAKEEAKRDHWVRVGLLADTIRQDELFDQDPVKLIEQVFADDDVRVFDPEPLRFECACSRERGAGLIEGLGSDEAIDILKEQGEIEIVCEFCNSKNTFDSIDVEAIFRGDGSFDANKVMH